jgi:hypothetical protein
MQPRSVISLCLRQSPWIVVPLFALAVTSIAVGAWALFAPGSFFEDFPLGQGWVSTDGPYNEHLVRDVGGLNLALGAVTVAVVLVGDTASRRLAAIGWLVYGLAHFVYHLHHLEPFTTIDAVLVAIATASTPVLALVAVLAAAAPTRRTPRSSVGGPDAQ